MRDDYGYVRADGSTIHIRDMTTQEINECLADGIWTDDCPASINPVLERLRIELVIRSLK